jgi:hypothetical protein
VTRSIGDKATLGFIVLELVFFAGSICLLRSGRCLVDGRIHEVPKRGHQSLTPDSRLLPALSGPSDWRRVMWGEPDPF